MKYPIAFGALALAAACHVAPALAAPTDPGACQSGKAAEDAVVKTMVDFFAAAGDDDLAAMQNVVSTDFYAYDAGARFTAVSLMDLIKKLHASGVRLEWNVTAPQVHLQCTTGWITYINQGARVSGMVREPATWLESANLAFRAGRWQIDFLHSTRVAAPK